MPVTMGRACDGETAWRLTVMARPGDSSAWRGLALTLADAGHFDEALASAEESVRLAPDDALAQRDFGGLLLQAGRKSEAIRALERAACLDARPDTLFALGEAYLGERLYEFALDTFALVTASRPFDAEAWGRLGLCHARLAGYEQALAAFAHATRLDSRYLEAYPDAAAAAAKARALLALESRAPTVYH